MMLLYATALALVLSLGIASPEIPKHGTPTRRDGDHYQAGAHDTDYDHEAVLGSHDEVDEFSQLPPEEAAKRLRDIVTQMDSNKDGFIDSDELTSWIHNSYLKLNNEDADEKMKTDDTDADGQLSWAEYLQAVYGMSEDDLELYKQNDIDDPEAQKLMEKSLKYDKKKFDAADLNGDGLLSKEEYAPFVHPYDYEHMSQVEAERVINDFDKDEDGEIAIDEYLENDQFAERNEEDMQAEQANFEYNDENKDGSLSMKEVISWVSPSLEEMANEEAAHLFEMTDTNHDNKLAPEEILAQTELWVGSEATDYGNMLLHEEL